MYGPTETTIWSTVSELTKKNKIDIGQPILNTRVYLLSDDMKEVTNGNIGEICISGSGLARGYLNSEIQTEKSFCNLSFYPYERIYRTGDLGRYDEDGDLLCLGRKDEQIKLRGHRIELEDIDTNMLKVTGIKMIASCFDTEKEQLISFYISDTNLDDKVIHKQAKLYLPEYMIPDKFCRVEHMMYTSSGKMDRRALLSANKDVEKIASEMHEVDSKIKDEVLEVVTNTIRTVTESTITLLDGKTKIEELALNSISYINMIVELESIFDIEFEDEKLGVTAFESVDYIVKYIKELM